MTQTTIDEWMAMSDLLNDIRQTTMRHNKEHINKLGFHIVFREDEWRDGPVLHIYTTPMKGRNKHEQN